jgi:hypothetical protein
MRETKISAIKKQYMMQATTARRDNPTQKDEADDQEKK